MEADHVEGGPPVSARLSESHSFWSLHRMLAECYISDVAVASGHGRNFAAPAPLQRRGSWRTGSESPSVPVQVPSSSRPRQKSQSEVAAISIQGRRQSLGQSPSEVSAVLFQHLPPRGRRTSTAEMHPVQLPPPVSVSRGTSQTDLHVLPSGHPPALSSSPHPIAGFAVHSTQRLLQGGHAHLSASPATDAAPPSPKSAKEKNARSLQTLLDLQGLPAAESGQVTEVHLHPRTCWQDKQLKKAATTARSRKSTTKSQATSLSSPTLNALGIGSPFSKDDEERQRPRMCLFHPAGSFRTFWTILVALIVLYDLLVIPLAAFDLPRSALLQSLETGIHVFWHFDFVLAFLTGYYSEGCLIMEVAKAVRHYARTWMLFDLGLLCMGWAFFILDYVASNASEWSRTIRMVRLLRLVRIFRAIKLRRGFAAVQDLLHSQAASLYVSFFNSLGQLLVLNHWISCAWFGVSWLDANNWVAASGLYERDFEYQYLTCALWAFAQLGVGESPLQPTSKIEMLLNCLIAFRSLITTATLISTMGNLIAGLRKIKEDETTEFRLLRRFLKMNHIPHDVGQKVTQFLQHQYAAKRHDRSADPRVPLLDLLSRPLFNELYFERYRTSLCSLLLIRDLLEEPDLQTLQALHQLATGSLCHVVAATGDMIFLSGNEANAAFVKVSGSVVYFREEGHEVVDSGCWVAEVCLWTPWVHMGDFEAHGMSDLLSLDAESFCSILGQTWTTQRAASIYATRFLGVMSKQKILSDIFVDWDGELDSMLSVAEEPQDKDLSFISSTWKRCCPTFSKRRRSSLNLQSLNQIVPHMPRPEESRTDESEDT